jgi:hypothetical protein
MEQKRDEKVLPPAMAPALVLECEDVGVDEEGTPREEPEDDPGIDAVDEGNEDEDEDVVTVIVGIEVGVAWGSPS